MSQEASGSISAFASGLSAAQRAQRDELFLAYARLQARPGAPASSEQDTWISAGAHPEVQKILTSRPSGNALGEAVIKVIKLHLALRDGQQHEDNALDHGGAEQDSSSLLPRKINEELHRSSLFVQAAQNFASDFGQSPQLDRILLEELEEKSAEGLFRRAIAHLTKLPFPVVVELSSLESAPGLDIDEW